MLAKCESLKFLELKCDCHSLKFDAGDWYGFVIAPWGKSLLSTFLIENKEVKETYSILFLSLTGNMVV